MVALDRAAGGALAYMLGQWVAVPHLQPLVLVPLRPPPPSRSLAIDPVLRPSLHNHISPPRPPRPGG